MGATVAFKEANGAGPDYSTVTAIRFCNTDAYNPLLTYPCVIPAAGDAYSYWKHVFLDLSGTYTRINNITFYSDGSLGWALGDGGICMIGLRDAGDNGCPDGDYDQATGNADTGDYMHDGTNGHAYYKGQTATPASVAGYTSGAKLTLDTANYDGVSDRTDGAVLQVQLHHNATRGEQADETFTFCYDEI